jgi:hypothetical protein
MRIIVTKEDILFILQMYVYLPSFFDMDLCKIKNIQGMNVFQNFSRDTLL